MYIPQPAVTGMNPEVIVRNNTCAKHGSFEPNAGTDLYPTIESYGNCWDAASNNRVAMWINDYDPLLSLYVGDYNLYRPDTGHSPVTENDTEESLATWRSHSGEGTHSLLPTGSDPVYAHPSYDLANYANHLNSSWTTAQDYYDAVRARTLGDNTANLIDFVSAAAYMIGQHEVTSPTPSGYTFSFYGSGDGSDPQIP